MPSAEDVRDWIAAGLECEHLDVYGPDGVHFEALVVSSAFVGVNRVGQHRLVYKALAGRMEEQIHALALKTMTPEEYRESTTNG
ncbi:MAG: BolA/IbaG family iron-sulfur metabolism protein [Betaproteobacteria bacterium]|nr:BolA/IbaG family iron-sulfur metabolism protein [Betaproteobacteria bacterium]